MDSKPTYPMVLPNSHGYKVHKADGSAFYLKDTYKGVKFRRRITVVEADSIAEIARSIEREIDSSQTYTETNDA